MNTFWLFGIPDRTSHMFVNNPRLWSMVASIGQRNVSSLQNHHAVHHAGHSKADWVTMEEALGLTSGLAGGSPHQWLVPRCVEHPGMLLWEGMNCWTGKTGWEDQRLLENINVAIASGTELNDMIGREGFQANPPAWKEKFIWWLAIVSHSLDTFVFDKTICGVHSYYRPITTLREGNAFSRVCVSAC